MRSAGIVLDTPVLDHNLRLLERVEELAVEAYMDPASAQGCLSMVRIGCSHISGLVLGHHFDTPGPDGIRALSPHHSCGLIGLASTQV